MNRIKNFHKFSKVYEMNEQETSDQQEDKVELDLTKVEKDVLSATPNPDIAEMIQRNSQIITDTTSQGNKEVEISDSFRFLKESAKEQAFGEIQPNSPMGLTLNCWAAQISAKLTYKGQPISVDINKQGFSYGKEFQSIPRDKVVSIAKKLSEIYAESLNKQNRFKFFQSKAAEVTGYVLMGAAVLALVALGYAAYKYFNTPEQYYTTTKRGFDYEVDKSVDNKILSPEELKAKYPTLLDPKAKADLVAHHGGDLVKPGTDQFLSKEEWLKQYFAKEKIAGSPENLQIFGDRYDKYVADALEKIAKDQAPSQWQYQADLKRWTDYQAEMKNYIEVVKPESKDLAVGAAITAAATGGGAAILKGLEQKGKKEEKISKEFIYGLAFLLAVVSHIAGKEINLNKEGDILGVFTGIAKAPVIPISKEKNESLKFMKHGNIKRF
jgi:hypothetical protein